MKRKAPVILLLAVFLVILTTSVMSKSPICDESGHHIASGYSYVKLGDFRMNPCTPPLLRILIGLPLLPLNLELPLDHSSWFENNSSTFNYQFLFVYNKLAEKVVFLSRLPMIALSVLLAWLIFIWTDELYGYKAGLAALFLFIFSPTVLGNGGLAMLDMGCAFFMFLASFQFWRYLKNKTVFNLVLTGVCFGLAQSAKYTAVILFPLFLIFAIADIILNKKGSMVKAIFNVIIIWIIGIIVLWATYFFEYKPLLENMPEVEEKVEFIRNLSYSVPFVNQEKLATFLIDFSKNTPIPLSTYLYSFVGVVKTVVVGQRLMLFGQEIEGGSKIYYLVNYLVKTPLAAIIMILLAVAFIRKRTKVGILANLFILLPIITMICIVTFSSLQGGLRYLLPMYPFLFVWLGDIVNYDFGRLKKLFYSILIGLGAWYFAVSMLVYPHYLSYFNELVGGPGGFGYKVTADLDWGQDFKSLKRYLDENNIEEVNLYCFGTVDPAYYEIKRDEVFPEEELKTPVKGEYYAVSARLLVSVPWTDEYKPIDRVGYNIFIYYIDDEHKI